jgi:hypothetical protein
MLMLRLKCWDFIDLMQDFGRDNPNFNIPRQLVVSVFQYIAGVGARARGTYIALLGRFRKQSFYAISGFMH